MRVKRHGYFVEMKQVGNSAFPRWCLRDSQQRYWSGKEWINQRTKALIYANEEECKRDLYNLMFGTPPKKFRATVTIHVDPSREFTIDQLRDYVRRNFKWRLKDDHGISPLDTALFHFQINVDELQEESNEPGSSP